MVTPEDRIKELHAKFLAEGVAHNEAAAKALGQVAKEMKEAKA